MALFQLKNSFEGAADYSIDTPMDAEAAAGEFGQKMKPFADEVEKEETIAANELRIKLLEESQTLLQQKVLALEGARSAVSHEVVTGNAAAIPATSTAPDRSWLGLWQRH